MHARCIRKQRGQQAAMSVHVQTRYDRAIERERERARKGLSLSCFAEQDFHCGGRLNTQPTGTGTGLLFQLCAPVQRTPAPAPLPHPAPARWWQ